MGPSPAPLPPALPEVLLRPVDAQNWRACAALQVAGDQMEFVSPVSYYLSLCHYGGVWHPLAAYSGAEVVGFAMWAVDPADGSGWVGGLTIDRPRQRQGLGRAMLEALLTWLRDEQGCTSAALSYHAGNTWARGLYASLGFVETGEMEDDELVARRPLPSKP